MASSIQLHTIVFVGLHWIYLLYYCGDISYWEISLYVVSHSSQIYLSYSKNWWVFHPSCLEGFPRVSLVSHGWLIYMTDLWRLFMWMIYLWDLYVAYILMWLMYSWYSYMYSIFICGWFMRFTCAEIDR